MTSATQTDLRELEPPQAHLLRTRDVTPIDRLRASTSLRRLLPTSAALPIAALVGVVRWVVLRGQRRGASLWAMRMLGSERPTRASRRLARRAMQDEVIKGELAWRPWTVASMEIASREHLEAARRTGRGVILVSAHVGPYLELLRVLALREGRIWVARYRPIRGQDPIPGYVGLRRVAAVGDAEAAGVRFVGRGTSYEAFRQLLARGEVCLLMFDFKGATKTTFLGHKARLSSGTANLAWELNVPIVPVFALRRGHRQLGEMRPALEPREFSSPAELHQALARLVSREIRANPHQAYPPEVIVTRWLRP